MRVFFSLAFCVVLLILLISAFYARRSPKAIGKTVYVLLLATMQPIIGNLVIIVSGNKVLSNIGCYIFITGMDVIVAAILLFIFVYCNLSFPNLAVRCATPIILLVDVVQLLLNPLTGHAFTTEKLIIGGYPYYRLVPYMGLTFHRFVCYGIILWAVVLLFRIMIRTPKIYAEKYVVIFISLMIGILWQTIMIFSRTPIDRSMIGIGIFGILTFYFSLFYRPMRLLDRMLGDIVSEMPEMMFFFDGTHKCIWANAPAKRFIGIRDDQLDEASPRLIEKFGKIEEDADNWNLQKMIMSEKGMNYYAIEKKTMTFDKNKISGSLISIRDNTEEQRTLRQEMFSATHDRLTGLYNREYLYERVKKLINSHSEKKYMVGFVDVRNFKMVNDVFGSNFGDYAIKCIANWLRTNFSGGGITGRLAGDTFGICVQTTDFDRKRVENELSTFMVEEGEKSHHVQIHLGLYEITDKNIDVSVMFDRAHMSLKTIKDDFQKHIAYYDDEMRNSVLWDQKITQEAQEAIRKKEIVPYLQPIVDATGKVVGAEALVRWIHPEHGFLPPAKFVPVFEKNGLIADVDRYMWRSACEILARWRKSGRDMFISVNISPKDFYFMDVPATLKRYVNEYGVSPARLRVEITESMMINDTSMRNRILEELKNIGFIVEMDDFGSGYSSLNMLKEMPVDVLKIDMMFLRYDDNIDKARIIIRNIIQLAEELGIESLTEGVETERQHKVLAEMGCKLFQGYHFAKPIAVTDFEEKYK